MLKSEKQIKEFNQVWIKFCKEIFKTIGILKLCKFLDIPVKEKWRY